MVADGGNAVTDAEPLKAPPTQPQGYWLLKPGDPDRDVAEQMLRSPKIVGSTIRVPWSEVNPKPREFHFREIEENLDLCRKVKKPAKLLIQTGRDGLSPSWPPGQWIGSRRQAAPAPWSPAAPGGRLRDPDGLDRDAVPPRYDDRRQPHHGADLALRRDAPDAGAEAPEGLQRHGDAGSLAGRGHLGEHGLSAPGGLPVDQRPAGGRQLTSATLLAWPGRSTASASASSITP